MRAPSDLVPGLVAWRSDGVPQASPDRFVRVDVLRGAALVGMAIYHVVWDLHAFGLVATDPAGSPLWRTLGQGVACVFLALSGFGLALARHRGVRLGATVRRLTVIAAAGCGVTLVTWCVMPEGTVVFGILQCIAVTNTVALALDRLGSGILVVVAIAALGAPALIHLSEAWWWSGLADVEPATLDFRPVLPWLGVVLVGLLAGRTSLVAWLSRARPPLANVKALAWAGRHSLALYLVHQPILVLAVALASTVLRGPEPADLLRSAAQATAFLRQCATTCTAGGGDPDVCTATCHCVLTAAVHSRSSASAWRPRLGQAADTSVREAIASCQARRNTVQ